MTILLVEDEYATARAIQRLLAEVRPEAEILAHLEAIEDTVAWLQTHPAPDLLLLDIHLADGLSFELFQQVEVTSPVIFITAYDEHALEAFKVNSIDYLLKPLTRPALARGLAQYDAQRRHYGKLGEAANGAGAALPPAPPAPDLAQLLRTMQQLSAPPPRQTSWLIPHKTKLVPVAAGAVAHFIIRHGSVYLTTLTAQEYATDFTLDQLETQLDPRQFFRANRQVLFARPSLAELEPYYNGRMLVRLEPAAAEDVIVSKPRVTELRDWVQAGG